MDIDRNRKLELIERSLGLKHKLRVHESMKLPDTHEDLAVMMLAKWELEDELRAIEEILSGTREKNVHSKRKTIEKEPPEERAAKQARKKNKAMLTSENEDSDE